MIFPATPFRFESDMLEPFSRGLRTTLSVPDDQAITVLREPTLGSVVPDLLVGLWGPERPSLFRRRLSLLDCHFLAMIEEAGQMSVTEAETTLRLTPGSAERVLNKLEKHGAVARVGSGAFELAATARTNAIEIVAVEAKLKRWQTALKQAEAYLEFANRAFVLLDGNQNRPSARMLEAFAQSPVGLLLQFGFLVQVVKNGEFHHPVSPYRAFAIHKLYRGEPDAPKFSLPAAGA